MNRVIVLEIPQRLVQPSVQGSTTLAGHGRILGTEIMEGDDGPLLVHVDPSELAGLLVVGLQTEDVTVEITQISGL